MASGADIYLEKILTEVYGKDVRTAIYNALKYFCDHDTDFQTAWDNYRESLEHILDTKKTDVTTTVNNKTTEANRTLDNKEAEVNTALNNKKTEVNEFLTAFKNDVIDTLNALIQVNEMTGAVVIHGDNLKLNYLQNNSMTVTQCLGMCASDVSTSKIANTSDDYLVTITLGGLI